MTKYRFIDKLIRPAGVGTWTYVKVPANVSADIGIEGQVPIRGTVGGESFRSTLMARGAGGHYLVVPRPLRDALGVAAGDEVDVEFEVDSEPRTVDVPADLAKALAENAAASESFGSFAPSYRKAYIDWIEDAKLEPTRARRLAKAVAMLAEGKKLKG